MGARTPRAVSRNGIFASAFWALYERDVRIRRGGLFSSCDDFLQIRPELVYQVVDDAKRDSRFHSFERRRYAAVRRGIIGIRETACGNAAQ